MQVLLELSDIHAAPAAVQHWISGQLSRSGVAAIEPTQDQTTEVAKVGTTKAILDDTPKATIKDVMDRAVLLLEAQGESALKAVLERVGIRRVKECPPEKFASFLTEVSIQES